MQITLCGSLTFNNEMLQLRDELETTGHTVHLPESTRTGQGKESWEQIKMNNPDLFYTTKAERMREHFEKIATSDAILVANYPKHDVEGYIGTNTLMEMAVAFYLKKKIYLLFPPPERYDQEELLSLDAKILSGNIRSIE